MMKRIVKIVTASLIAATLIAPQINAQTRGRVPSSRPGNNGAPANQPSHQPSTPPSQRPGNQPNPRPNPQPNPRPNPQPNPRPNPHPNPGPVPPPPPPRPHNPHVRPVPPSPGAWYRPTPPPSWRPPSVWRPFNSILGIALGSSINFTLNSLFNGGYAVSNYGNNTINVANVMMLNLMWPDAVLYFNAYGGLCGSKFIYGSAYSDMSRYNAAYSTLISIYGLPYRVQNTASGIEASWWGRDNQFITLSYSPHYAIGRPTSYFTTLTFGN